VPLTLVTAIGSATANSYNTVAALDAMAAEAYPEPTDWTALGDDPKARIAAEGTRVLDQLTFPGFRADDVQALEWPRHSVEKPSRVACYTTTEIPTGILRAHARICWFLAEQNAAGITDPFAAPANTGLSSIDLGDELRMAFEKGATSDAPGEVFLRTVICPMLNHLVMASQARTVR
jgi:hypothetical protein